MALEIFLQMAKPTPMRILALAVQALKYQDMTKVLGSMLMPFSDREEPFVLIRRLKHEQPAVLGEN